MVGVPQREREFKERFEKWLEFSEIRILRETEGKSVDLIVKWDDEIVAVELKSDARTTELERALAQLLLAKLHVPSISSLWLMLDDVPKRGACDIIRLLWSFNIQVSIFCDSTFIDITPANLENLTGKKSSTWKEDLLIDDDTLGVLKAFPGGLSIESLAEFNIWKPPLEKMRERIEVATSWEGVSLLRGEIKIDGDRVKLLHPPANPHIKGTPGGKIIVPLPGGFLIQDRRRDRLKWIDNPDGILTSEEIQQKLTLDEESEKSSATADLKNKAAKKNNEAELKKNDYCYRYSNELKLSPISY